jgi:hypothetical protein
MTKTEEFIVKGMSKLPENQQNAFIAIATLMCIEGDIKEAQNWILKSIGVDMPKVKSSKEPDEPQTLSEAELSLLATPTKNDDSWKEQEWTEYPTFNSVDVNGGDGGYIYAAEYGEYIKIGYTVSPKTRLGNHAATAKNYGNITTGRVLLSPPHKSYQKTEKLLHGYFKEYRKEGTELFEMPFDGLKAQIRGAILEVKEEAK